MAITCTGEWDSDAEMSDTIDNITDVNEITNDDIATYQTKRKRVKRNTSFASKLQCFDLKECEIFLKTCRCPCENECLRKLYEHKDKGVDVIYNLRHERFARTFVLIGIFFTPG